MNSGVKKREVDVNLGFLIYFVIPMVGYDTVTVV
jgi:hypothetical protein